MQRLQQSQIKTEIVSTRSLEDRGGNNVGREGQSRHRERREGSVGVGEGRGKQGGVDEDRGRQGGIG